MTEENSKAHTRDNKWGEVIHAKQIDMLFRQIPGVIVGPNSGAVLLLLILWDQLPHSLLIGWLLVNLIFVGLFPALLLWRYRKDDNRAEHSRYWANLLSLNALLGGLTWGSAGYLFFTPDQMEYQMVLFLFLYAAAAVTMTTMVSCKREFYAVAVPMLVPIAVRSAQMGDEFHLIMTVTTFVYLGVMIYFHRTAHLTIIQSFRLQYENLDLAEENAKKNQQAVQANLEKSRFLAAASHDLRQPLHAQVLFVAELKSRIQDIETREILGHLEQSMDTMRDLFDALLDISKLDGDMVVPVVRNFQVTNLLSSLESEYTPQANIKQIKLRIVPCSYAITSDQTLMENILRNLLSNAIRNTSQGSIMVCCRKRNNHIVIEVRDSGIGIPEDKLSYIFEEFSQLDNPERDREKGLGLGLAIVDRLSKLLKHPVTIKSSPGKGSTFSVAAPLSLGTQNDNSEKYSYHSANNNIAGLCVLVIDDDATITQAMYGLLKSWGCQVLIASSADEAIALINSSELEPEIIISDYRLREDKTGAEAIDLIQQRLNNHVPAILITGDTAAERLLQANASGHQLLHKPVDPAKLHNLIGMLSLVKP